MTRKDYILIAEVLRVQLNRARISNMDGSEVQRTAMQTIYDLAVELADSLSRDNSRFDTTHFLAVIRREKELTSRPLRS